MTYVYPVVSRRAGGVSVGINLNPNNACNWACIYCQVPNLVRGSGPELDLAVLESELRALLTEILHGDFMQNHVPEGARRLNDIALSGNGEPTSSRQFPAVIDLIGRIKTEFGLKGKVKLVLISNGSLMDRSRVQSGLRRMAGLDGEVWFKVDSATVEGLRRINQTRTSPDKIFERLNDCLSPVPDLAADLHVCQRWQGAERGRTGSLSGLRAPDHISRASGEGCLALRTRPTFTAAGCRAALRPERGLA